MLLLKVANKTFRGICWAVLHIEFIDWILFKMKTISFLVLCWPIATEKWHLILSQFWETRYATKNCTEVGNKTKLILPLLWRPFFVLVLNLMMYFSIVVVEKYIIRSSISKTKSHVPALLANNRPYHYWNCKFLMRFIKQAR